MKQKIWRLQRIFWVLLGAVCWMGCQSVPITGRKQLLLTSESSENTLGLQAWQEIKTEHKISKNATQVSALKRVGPIIQNVSSRPDFQWEFLVFESDVPNAFCLPGGKVAVYSGLFRYVANDAELATVVSHEIGHALARHGGERISLEQVKNIGGTALQLSGKVGDGWLLAYNVGTQYGAMLPFSRTHEYEADHIGMILMGKAGYDPQAAISFWKKFATAGGASGATEWASTHPSGENRIQELQSLLPAANAEYEKAPIKRGLGQTISAK